MPPHCNWFRLSSLPEREASLTNTRPWETTEGSFWGLHWQGEPPKWSSTFFFHSVFWFHLMILSQGGLT